MFIGSAAARVLLMLFVSGCESAAANYVLALAATRHFLLTLGLGHGCSAASASSRAARRSCSSGVNAQHSCASWYMCLSCRRASASLVGLSQKTEAARSRAKAPGKSEAVRRRPLDRSAEDESQNLLASVLQDASQLRRQPKNVLERSR